MTIVWYVLIHVSLGLIGSDYFRFTNAGALYASPRAPWCRDTRCGRSTAGAGHVSREPGFRRGARGGCDRAAGLLDRIGRLFIFRVSAFSILTLLIAFLVRGAGP